MGREIWGTAQTVCTDSCLCIWVPVVPTEQKSYFRMLKSYFYTACWVVGGVVEYDT